MTTNQPLSLFISSKMQELAEERHAVQAALSDFRMYGWLWEDDAGARPMPIRSTYLKEVEVCDVYIGLFWLGYGPYTIEEYEQARKYNKPCLVYQKHVTVDQRDQQLVQFLRKIEKVDALDGLTVRRFTTAEEVATFVQEDVMRLLTSTFRESRQQPQSALVQDVGMQTRERELDFVEQVELTNRLLKCSAIRDRSQREVVLRFLPSDLTQRIIRGDTDITDVLQIVKKCSEYREGIQKLAWAVTYIDGNTLSLQEVLAYLKQIGIVV